MKKAAKLLKRLGLIDYDLRKKLNSGQAARVSRLLTLYPALTQPESMYEVKRVSTRTAQEIQRGYGNNVEGPEQLVAKSKGGRKRHIVILKKNSPSDVFRIRRGTITRYDVENGLMTRYVRVEGNILEALDKLRQKPGELLTAVRGSDATWKDARFFDKEALRDYLHVTYRRSWEYANNKRGKIWDAERQASHERWIESLNLVRVIKEGNAPRDIFAASEAARPKKGKHRNAKKKGRR